MESRASELRIPNRDTFERSHAAPEHRKNIEHPTSNAQHRTRRALMLRRGLDREGKSRIIIPVQSAPSMLPVVINPLLPPERVQIYFTPFARDNSSAIARRTFSSSWRIGGTFR